MWSDPIGRDPNMGRFLRKTRHDRQGSFYKGVSYSYSIEFDEKRQPYMLLEYQEGELPPVFYDIHFLDSEKNLLEVGREGDLDGAILERLARKASHVVKTLTASRGQFERASIQGGKVLSLDPLPWERDPIPWEQVKDGIAFVGKDQVKKTYEKKIENIYNKLSGCLVELRRVPPPGMPGQGQRRVSQGPFSDPYNRPRDPGEQFPGQRSYQDQRFSYPNPYQDPGSPFPNQQFPPYQQFPPSNQGSPMVDMHRNRDLMIQNLEEELRRNRRDIQILENKMQERERGGIGIY